MSDGIVVVGAGGHAKVVVSTLQAADLPIACLVDDDRARWGKDVLGVEVRGPLSAAPEFGSRGVLAFGSNQLRRRLARDLPLEWVTVEHPVSWVHSSVRLGPGTVVFAGAMIQPDTVIGSHVIVNTGATIDHDCAIGDFAHVAPGVNVAGSAALGEGVLVGIGSCILPGVEVGKWSVVGAGAVVANRLPEGVTAVGIPARSVTELEREDPGQG